MSFFKSGRKASGKTGAEEGTGFMELAAGRYSTRSFTNEKVPQEVIDRMLEAGRLAPTAKDKQPQRIYVIKSEEAISKLGQVTKCLYGAPQALLICYDEKTVWNKDERHNTGVMDCSIVLTHIMLEATDLGISTCWVKMWDEDEMSKAFDLPSGIHPVALMPFGYPGILGIASPLHHSRKPISETTSEL